MNLGGILLVLFITLKLLGIINWSWLWVLSPLWLPLAIVLAFVAVVFLFTVFVSVLQAIFGK